MAEKTHHTSPHDPADHGHHGHHILSAGLLLKVFFALVGLTVLTVVLAYMERGDMIHFGGEAGSVGVALFIAGIKGTLVAMFFMALKYDNKVNALAFIMSIVFLAVFFIFTFLDTGFRGQFDGVPDARPIDKIQLEQREAQRADEALQERGPAQPMVAPGDTVLLGPAPGL
jgi:cytochrome c oxidase subunit IV